MAKQQDPKKKAEEIKDSFEDVTLSIKDLEKELSKVFNTKKLDNFVKTLTSGFEDSIDYSDKIQDKMTDMSKSVTSLSKEFGSLRGELNSFSKDISNIKVPTLNITSNINEVDISSLQESIKNLPNINLNASISNVDTSKLENIDLPVLDDIQANIKFNTQPIDLPTIDDINANVKFNVQTFELPKVDDIQANIKYNTQPVELPDVQDIQANIKFNTQSIEIPEVSDINASIKYNTLPIDLPKLDDINASIKYDVQTPELPKVENINAVINYNNQVPDAPKVEDIQANIKFNVQDLELPNFNDITLNAKLNKIDLSELDKMPISELMAEIGLVDTSLLDKTIDKYNPIILSSIIDTPDVSQLSNIAQNTPSIQLQTEVDTSNATAAIQDQANATNEITTNTIASTKALDKMQKKYNDIVKKINEGGKASKSELKFLTDYSKNLTNTVQASTKSQNEFRNSINESTAGQKQFAEISKELASYDGPRFKASGLVTKEIANQISQSKFLKESKTNLLELDGRATILSKVLAADADDLSKTTNDLVKGEENLTAIRQELASTGIGINKLKLQEQQTENRLYDISIKRLNLDDQIKSGKGDTSKLEEEYIKLMYEETDLLEKTKPITAERIALQQKQNELEIKRNSIAQSNNELEEKHSTLLSATAIQASGLVPTYELLTDITKDQITEHSTLAAKMAAVEKSAYAVGTAQYSQIDLTDQITDQIERQRSLEQARINILEQQNKLTPEQFNEAMNIVDANIKINQEQLKTYQALQKTSEGYNAIQEKAEGLRDSMMAPVDKLFGIVPSGLSKMLGLDSLQAELKDKLFKSIATGFMTAGGGAAGFFAAASAGASTLMASLAPILPLLLAIAGVVGLVKLFMDADKAVGDLSKELNISYKEGIKVYDTANDIAVSLGQFGVTAGDVTKQMTEMSKVMGINLGTLSATNSKAKEFLETSTLLSKRYGTTAEENAELNAAAAITGTSMDKMALTVESMSKDGLVPAGELMKDIGKVSKGVLFNFKGNVVALAKAVKQAKLMGTTLNQMNTMGEGLMNIETQIAAQNKARILTGRNINMDAARYYYMTGQTSQMMDEMVKQMGSAAEYEKLGPMQRKAYAEAMGMGVDQLDEMMAKQLELEQIGLDQNKLQEILNDSTKEGFDMQKALASVTDEKAKEMLKEKILNEQNLSVQEKLANTMQRVMTVLYKMVSPLLPIVDAFIDSLLTGTDTISSMGSAFSGVGSILKDSFSVLTAVFSAVMQFAQPVIDIVNSLLNSFKQLSGTGEGFGNTIKDIGAIILTYLEAPFLAVYEFVAGFVQGIMPIVDSILGLVRPILDLFTSASNEGGGLFDILMGIGGAIQTIGKYAGYVFSAILTPIGSLIKGVLEPLKGIFGKIIDAFSPITELFKSSGKEGKSFMDTLKPVLDIVQKIGNVIGTLIAANFEIVINAIKQSVKVLMGFWDIIAGIFTLDGDRIVKGLSSIGGAIIDTITAPFKVAYKYVTDLFGPISFSKIGKSIVNGISTAVESLFDILTWPFKTALDFIGDLFGMGDLGSSIIDGFKDIVGNVGKMIIKYFSDYWDVIAGIFTLDGDRILDGLSGIGEALFNMLTYPFEKIINFIGDLFGIGNLGSSIIDGVKDIFSDLGNMIIGYFSSYWDVIAGIFTFDGDRILEGLKGIGSAIISMITYPFEKAMNIIGNLFGFKELGSSILNNIKSFGGKLIDIIKMPFVKAIDWISNTFSGIGRKLSEGIASVATTIWNMITEPFKKAWDWITSLFSGTGKKIVEGISNLATDVRTTITNSFKSGYDWVVSTFSNVGQKIVDGISSVGGDIVNSITAPFTQAWDSISGWLGFSPSELGNGIVKGISSVSGDIESNLTKPFDSAEQQVSKSASAMADSVSNISGGASISITGVDTAGISQIKDIEKDLRKVKVDVIEEKLGELSDAFNAMDWSLLKEFANLATVNLGDAGKSLITGINSLTGISKSVNLDELKDTFEQLTDTLNELDWENLKTFAGLATTNLSGAGKALIDGINSLTGISDKVNLDSLKDTFEQLTDTLNELNWENLKTFATLATTNLAGAGKALIDGINSLTGISDKVNLDSLKDTFEQLTDTLNELNWESLKTFATLATTNLSAAGKSLIDGINSLTGINNKVNLDSLKDTFTQLTDTLNELDWENLKVFATLATSNLANAGNSIIAGINSLAGIKDKINLDGAESAFKELNSALEELDLDAITKFADLASKNLSTAGTNIKNGLVTLGSIKEVSLDGVSDVFNNLSNVLEELDLELITKFADTDFAKLNTNVTAISNALTSLSAIGSIDLSGISDKGALMASFLSDIADIEYDAIDELAVAISSLADSYTELAASMKGVSDEDLARVQQVASISGNSNSSGLSSLMSGLFGGNDEEETGTESTSTTTPSVMASTVTPIMQQPMAVSTQPTVEVNTAAPGNNNQMNLKNVETLLKELISKVNQPVQLKIGDGPIRDIQSVMSLNRSYTANVNGYRV